jgi:hypothetical protein
MANKIIEWAIPKIEAIQTPEPTNQQRNLLLNGGKIGKRKNGG